MQLVWQTTGDWLEIDLANPGLAEYWVESLNRDKINNFNLIASKFDSTWPELLKTHISKINEFLISKLKITALESFQNLNLLDQRVLNDIHRTWIGLINTHPSLVTLIKKYDEKLWIHWNQINKKVHFIEEGFECVYCGQQYWETPNIFGTEILNFNQCQLQIIFSQEGRTNYNKWLVHDTNSIGPDTNNFKAIGSEVLISLSMPLYRDAPKNYIEYSKQNNIPVIGDILNLGNFQGFEENLTELRHVYLRNVLHENNTALFKI